MVDRKARFGFTSNERTADVEARGYWLEDLSQISLNCEATMNDGPSYGFVLQYALRDEVCDWVEQQANAADYGISCAFQQRQVEALSQGWLQVDAIETPSLLVWCDDADAADAFRVSFGAHVKDVVARAWDARAALH